MPFRKKITTKGITMKGNEKTTHDSEPSTPGAPLDHDFHSGWGSTYSIRGFIGDDRGRELWKQYAIDPGAIERQYHLLLSEHWCAWNASTQFSCPQQPKKQVRHQSGATDWCRGINSADQAPERECALSLCLLGQCLSIIPTLRSHHIKLQRFAVHGCAIKFGEPPDPRGAPTNGRHDPEALGYFAVNGNESPQSTYNLIVFTMDACMVANEAADRIFNLRTSSWPVLCLGQV
ncbi:hypothetical protein N7497_012208 [Penicillium chrysogenum]|nr:hypothetical protein N7497_012208 [Penicillium chrysogenum]